MHLKYVFKIDKKIDVPWPVLDPIFNPSAKSSYGKVWCPPFPSKLNHYYWLKHILKCMEDAHELITLRKGLHEIIIKWVEMML